MYSVLIIYVSILLQFKELIHYLPSKFCRKIIYCKKVCSFVLIIYAVIIATKNYYSVYPVSYVVK
jgi:hypothetical protein